MPNMYSASPSSQKARRTIAVSKYSKSLVCLNGPKEGTWIDAPADVAPGRSVALPWDSPKGTQYAVYTVTRIDPDPTSEKYGLLFIKSHPDPQHAEEHVNRIAFAIGMAKEAAEMN